MKALELRAKGADAREVSAATGFHASSVTRLVAKYRDKGIEAIAGNHYGGNRRNMSVSEEATFWHRLRNVQKKVSWWRSVRSPRHTRLQ